LVADGTDTHLLLIDLRDQEIDSKRVEKVMEHVSVATSKNWLSRDKVLPFGLRLGSTAMTARGCMEADFM